VKNAAAKIGILFSGGLDSAALLGAYANKNIEVWPVYVGCGLPWEAAETHFARRFLRKLPARNIKPLAVLNMPLEGAYQKNWSKRGNIPDAESDDREVFLPARNLILCVKALLFLSAKGVNDIALATLRGNPFEDATPQYVKKLQHVLRLSFQHPVRILMPFQKLTKEKVIRKHKTLPLEFSLSCINPTRDMHCGVCNKCAERKRAFRVAGVHDRTRYAKKIRN
jgi:7-cyano-7-deazaguanine synthase